MNKRSFAVVALSTVCLATILAAVPTNSLVGYYDPWLDYDENGNIDMKDVAASARAFGSYGDPTKNVSVVNWPVSSQVCIWWAEYLTTFDSLTSDWYKSHGFSRIHIIAEASDLARDERIRLSVYGIMENPAHTGFRQLEVYSTTLTATAFYVDTTIFVPSEKFNFGASTDIVSDGYIYLNFYLTWA